MTIYEMSESMWKGMSARAKSHLKPGDRGRVTKQSWKRSKSLPKVREYVITQAMYDRIQAEVRG